MKKYKVLKGHLVYKENTKIIDNNCIFVMPGGDSVKIYQLHKDGEFIDHVQDMCINELIEEGIIEEIKKVYEVGKYYKDPSSSEIFFIDEEKNMYGFDVDGSWLNDECFLIGEPLDDYMETTEQEFKERLLRYVKENYTEGTVFKSYIGDAPRIVRNTPEFKPCKTHIITINGSIVYSDGQWAKIIKKPIYELGDGSFLYEEDLIKGKVYSMRLDNGHEWIIDFDKLNDSDEPGDYEVQFLSAINLNDKSYHVGANCIVLDYVDKIESIKPATKKQIKHLERCEKAEKYVPRKEKKKYTDSDMIEFHKFSTAESTEYAKKDLKDWKKRGLKND